MANKGYDGENPWHHWANSGRGEDGEILSGWLLKHASEPSAVENEDSETPYTTTRAIEFMEQAKDENWCLHLSYIKPHWPYIVPAPYHDMYGPEDIIPVNRSNLERRDPHPLMAAYYDYRYGRAFSRDDVREAVIPAYMGLITQIDDQIGRLMSYLKESGQINDTMIVFTSDHGDGLPRYKRELFDTGINVPFLVLVPEKFSTWYKPHEKIYDLVSFLDIAPTVLDLAGIPIPSYMDGKSIFGKEKNEYIFAARDRLDNFKGKTRAVRNKEYKFCLLYTSPSPRDKRQSRMPSSA